MVSVEPICSHLSHQYLLQSKNYISLHVDVKERTFISMKHPIVQGKNGGPDRTRTYDPRLIKAVL